MLFGVDGWYCADTTRALAQHLSRGTRLAEIAVAHLVRWNNSPEVLRRFVESYRRHRAGIDHELLIILKGFRDEVPPEISGALRDCPHATFRVPDDGFDIGAYFRAARQCDHRHFVFLNSYSRILCDDWLAKMARHVMRDDVGAVAATGSWQSSNALARRRQKQRSVVRRWLFKLKEPFITEHFAPFPNAHLRTNAFMASREVLSRIRVGPLRTKMDAFVFESGLNGFTAQVLAMSLRILVVGCDGRGYEIEEWPESRTFRNHDHGNLLVADNQTDLFEQASAAEREDLATRAWGNRAMTPNLQALTAPHGRP